MSAPKLRENYIVKKSPAKGRDKGKGPRKGQTDRHRKMQMHASLPLSHNLWALLSPSCNLGALWQSGRASIVPLNSVSAPDDTVIICCLSTLISPLRLSLFPSCATLGPLCH